MMYGWMIDNNNDGWMDLFVANSHFDFESTILDYKTKTSNEKLHPKFYVNKNGRFIDATKEVKLNRIIKNMGINSGDIDNDGFPDIYAGTGDISLGSSIPNIMLKNKLGQFFEDVSSATKTSNLKHGHGVSFGDIDNDGDQDIYEVMGDGNTGDSDNSLLFLNPGTSNHWICIKLEGISSNRAAIGAKLRINIQTPNGNRDIYSSVSSGGSFGASTLRREIGLSDAKKINYIEIYWPASDKKQRFKNLELDSFYKIVEGNKNPILLPVNKFKMPASESFEFQNHPHN